MRNERLKKSHELKKRLDAARRDIQFAAFRIPHSAFRIPHSAFRIPTPIDAAQPDRHDWFSSIF
jgi:hypothetical protein